MRSMPMKFLPHEIVIYKMTNELCVITGGDWISHNYYIQKGTEVHWNDFTFKVTSFEIEKLPEPNDILKGML